MSDEIRPLLAPSDLLDRALAQVASTSIRVWASSEHNRPIFVQLAQGWLDKSGPNVSPVLFSAYIVCLAMEL